ncbi:unnamed protein product [Bursaphelenchus okinawaensis]|uniref:Uncharacterized protein n=1 Tax=Bursaphelenchus okinawaensis TaxID=465554 RepID=A0A811JT85_9BILA|nr:unnamed protein product [Bursaphelenchus okinawaensis]CAG9081926.1 unnamed protein product [Bursaphelenchus okinawaensis]
MFKRTPAHEDYPASEAYTGPIDETARQGEVEGLPLEHHVSVYHSGRSDVEPHKHEEPVVEPVKEKSDKIGKIVGMFKRTPAHEDYPASVAYTGPIDETARQGEVEGLPLEHHVSVYHSGRSDVEPHKHEEPVAEPVKEKSDTIGKIVGMFKRTPAHEDYPASEAYTGPIDETARQGEVEGLPLEHHVSVYHSGRSDVEPHKHEEPVAEPVKEKSDTIGKIVGMFKRTPAHDDYPASEAYTGPIDETARQGEVEGLPLENHVSVYHSGRSDVEPHKHEEPVVEPVKEKSDKIGKIVGMFKRTPAHEDYPASEAYTGPIDETARQGEVEGLPLEHHVSVYHSGRSDVVPHKHEEPVVEPVKEKSDKIGKIVGMFKRTPAHEDYPASVAYTGPIDETARQGEVEGLPLEHHVSVYHSGRSDVEPHKHEEPVVEPDKEKSEKIGKIVGMFKRTPAHEDYPASEAYTGPIDETARQSEVEGLPLEHHVSVYHSGRSDVEPHKHEEPVAEPVKEKSDTIGKIVGMFKRTPAHEDYPASEAYTGPIDETARQGEVEGLPLEHHVSVYHSGRSDVEPHKHEEPVVEPDKEKSEKIGKIVGMFKRTPAHEDYPASEAYTGPIDETARQGEVEGLPLEHHVSVYHSGRSDVEPRKHEELATNTSKKSAYSPSYKYRITTNDKFAQYSINREDAYKAIWVNHMTEHEAIQLKLRYERSPVHTLNKQREVRNYPLEVFVKSKSTIFDNSSGKCTLRIESSPHPHKEIEHIVHTVVVPFEDRQWREDGHITIDRYTTETPVRKSRYRVNDHLDQNVYVGRREKSMPSYLEISEDKIEENRNKQYKSTYSSKYASTSRSLSESRRVTGWTTITEKTTISYSRRIRMERETEHKRQNYTEDVLVYNYKSPQSSSKHFSPNTTTFSTRPNSPISSSRRYVPRHSEVEKRYQSYRSQSQGPLQTDRWIQTDINNHSPYHLRSNSASSKRTYRSYRSNLYDRESIIRGYYPERNWVDQIEFQDVRGNEGRISNIKYSTNLDEVPIVRLLDELSFIGDERHDMEVFPATTPRVVPLETRLLEPGHHRRSRADAPIRRTRHRIRNYCAML